MKQAHNRGKKKSTMPTVGSYKINKTDKPLIILIKEKEKTEFLGIRNRII